MQRLVALLLILLFAFDVGACPCGCWDHNGWLELVEARHDHHDHEIDGSKIDGDDGSHDGHVGCTARTAETETLSMDTGSHVCDGIGKPRYRPTERPLDLSRHRRLGAVAQLATVPMTPTSLAPSRHRDAGEALDRSPVTLRAALQVWLV